MSDPTYDVVIIGAGPAGIQAAIHAARKKAKVLMLGRIENSSLFGAHIENYACVSGVTDGGKFLEEGLKQVEAFGAETAPQDVLKIEQTEEMFSVHLEDGRNILTRTVIFCMGVSKKKLNVPGEKEFAGRGVSYCVDCDANFYRGATVAVTGDRSAAVDGAITLTGYASKVYLVTEEFNVSEELRKRLKESDVECIGSSVSTIEGEHAVNSVHLANGDTLETEGIFIELGSKGALELATQVDVRLDTESFKYIDTNRQLETNIPGIYAAGDIIGPPYQMAKAVGEGCIAGMEAATYARKKRLAQQGEDKTTD